MPPKIITTTWNHSLQRLSKAILPLSFILVLLVTTVLLLEVHLEAVVSSALKDSKNTSDVALIFFFVVIIATEKTLKRGCAIFLIFGTTLRVFVQKYRHQPPPCRPMAVSLQNNNGSFLGIFTHLGSTWQEEVNGLDRIRQNETCRFYRYFQTGI